MKFGSHLIQVSWFMPCNVVELLQCWKTQGWGQSKTVIWKVISTLLMWSIWKERNPCLFEDRKSNVLQLKSSFLSALLDWFVSLVPNFFSSNLVDLVNFLDFRLQYYSAKKKKKTSLGPCLTYQNGPSRPVLCGSQSVGTTMVMLR